MKFSKELQLELQKHSMWVEKQLDGFVQIVKDDGKSIFPFAEFNIINGEWHMTTPPYQIHMNMEVLMHLLSVMGELTKHSVENGVLKMPEFLI